MLACGSEKNTQLTALVNYADSVSRFNIAVYDTVYTEKIIDPNEDPEDPRNHTIDMILLPTRYNDLLKAIDVNKLSAIEKEALQKVEDAFGGFMNVDKSGSAK